MEAQRTRGGVKYKRAILDSYMNLYQNIEKAVKNEDTIIIPRLVVSVTNKCTLKCEHCTALIPYFSKRTETGVDEIVHDLEKVLSVVDECVVLEFIGGEPFLYHELGTLLQFVQGNKKVKMIEITTNATVIPNKELMLTLTDRKTIVLISNYPQCDLQKMNEIQKIFEENKVNYRILKMNNWYDYGGIERRKRNKNQLKYSFYHCYENEMCRTLCEGKIFVCSRAASLYVLGKLTDDSSYLEIRNNDRLTGDDIKRFYIKKKYAEACDFCDGYRDIFRIIEVAKQYKRK